MIWKHKVPGITMERESASQMWSLGPERQGCVRVGQARRPEIVGTWHPRALQIRDNNAGRSHR